MKNSLLQVLNLVLIHLLSLILLFAEAKNDKGTQLSKNQARLISYK